MNSEWAWSDVLLLLLCIAPYYYFEFWYVQDLRFEICEEKNLNIFGRGHAWTRDRNYGARCESRYTTNTSSQKQQQTAPTRTIHRSDLIKINPGECEHRPTQTMYAISNIYLIVGQEDAQKVQYRTLECMLFVVAITGALCRRRGRRLRCVVWILPLAFQSGSLLSIVIVLSLPTTSITNLALSFCFDNLRYLSRHWQI